jgi:hypothetical protein
MDEYIYTYATGAFPTILTPFGIEFTDIKKEITQTPDCIKNVSTYPNGLVLEMTQYADKIIVKSNKKFITNADGTVSIEL